MGQHVHGLGRPTGDHRVTLIDRIGEKAPVVDIQDEFLAVG
jgi:hypothetical protein